MITMSERTIGYYNFCSMCRTIKLNFESEINLLVLIHQALNTMEHNLYSKRSFDDENYDQKKVNKSQISDQKTWRQVLICKQALMEEVNSQNSEDLLRSLSSLDICPLLNFVFFWRKFTFKDSCTSHNFEIWVKNKNELFMYIMNIVNGRF